MEAASYVLQEFTPGELALRDATLEHAVDAVLTFVSEDLVTAMNRFNGAMESDNC
jgi:peptidyl-tRNA hydrolase